MTGVVLTFIAFIRRTVEIIQICLHNKRNPHHVLDIVGFSILPALFTLIIACIDLGLVKTVGHAVSRDTAHILTFISGPAVSD